MNRILKNNINSNKKKRILLFSVILLVVTLGASWIVLAGHEGLFDEFTGIDQAHHNPLWTEKIVAIGDHVPGGAGGASTNNILIDADSVSIGTATPNLISGQAQF